MRILLVEDSPEDAELVETYLDAMADETVEIVRADTLAGAEGVVASPELDAVLLDLHLPDARGIDTLTRLMARGPSAPVIVMTGMGDDALGREALRHGAQDFLVKGSFDRHSLARSIRYARERHLLLQRLEGALAEARAGEENFRNLVERSIEAVVVVDEAGCARFVNPAATDLFGEPAQTMLGRPLSIDVEASVREILVRHESGRSIPAELRVAAMEWRRRPSRLVMLRDLSERKRVEEIALVRNLQRAFQPERALAECGPFVVAGANDLCEDVSGDYYDFFPLRDGRLVVALGDVAGHGLMASLVMFKARAFLRAFGWTLRSLGDVVVHINDFLSHDMSGGRFMSLFVGVLDADRSALSWVNAGHLPPLLLRAGGALERLEATGPVVGAFAGAAYEEGRTTTLEPGDLLLAFTDGVTEARGADGAFLGEEGVVRTLGALPPPHHDAERVVDAVRESVRDWTGHAAPEDDVTVVALARRP
jgi:serine phosphatase RsbU (regulator of sigma subunit)/DNA-binding NarL/FixJ family response regulator